LVVGQVRLRQMIFAAGWGATGTPGVDWGDLDCALRCPSRLNCSMRSFRDLALGCASG